MNTIALDWKSFSVNLDTVRAYFKSALSSNFDGLFANDQNLSVIFLSDISDADAAIVSAYWASLNEHSFNPTAGQITIAKLNQATAFGCQMVVDAAVTHMSLGVVQAGKTKAVADYFRDLRYYLQNGALYAALEEIALLEAGDIPSDLAPFVTADKIHAAKNKIQAFLGITPT